MTKRPSVSRSTGNDASLTHQSFEETRGTTTSRVHLATFATTEVSRFDDTERYFLARLLESEVFGALLEACRAREKEKGLTRADLARRMDKDKAQITKLLRNPTNMKLTMLSDWANGVETDIAFCLVDRENRSRVFTGHGVEHLWAHQALSNTFTFMTESIYNVMGSADMHVLPDLLTAFDEISEKEIRDETA